MDEDERQDGEDELPEYVPPTDETEDGSEGDDESLEEGNGSEDEETESEGQDDEVDFGADAENQIRENLVGIHSLTNKIKSDIAATYSYNVCLTSSSSSHCGPINYYNRLKQLISVSKFKLRR